MPLKAKVPAGRAYYYLIGTVRAGKQSRSVNESTGIGARDPGASAKAEEIRLRREGEIYHEILYGPSHVVTFSEAAAEYCADRNRRRVAQNPALAGRPDKEAEYVAKWIKFLRGRGLADIPLADFCSRIAELRATPTRDGRKLPDPLNAYFQELHVAKGNKLPTMTRESDVYCAVMNFAADKARKWTPDDFPRPDLPKWDALEIPVNKWLYDEEVRLFVKLAPKHLRIYVAGVFATGIRGGELLFVSRRYPNYADQNGTGLALDPGREHFYLGWTKSKKPIFRTIPDWFVAMLHLHLESRKDKHDALVLTEEGRPYKRPRRQQGFLVETAWKRMRGRVAAVIERLARRKARQALRLKGDARLTLLRQAAHLRERAAKCRTVTPHWGRHNAASHQTMRGQSDIAIQKAAGWQSATMKKRYTHLSPEFAKDLANSLDFGMGRARHAIPRAVKKDGTDG